MINVLIVEDSAVVRDYLYYLLSSDPDVNVVGTASDGQQAVELAKKLVPNVITMDIHMPRMNGLEATRRILEVVPTPIVMVSADWNPEAIDVTFKALEAGAVTILETPKGFGDPNHAAMAKKLVQTVKTMSEVKMVRRRPQIRQTDTTNTIAVATAADIRYVAIGTSTGGPVVLQSILSALPATFPVPILIVQHITKGFTQGLVDWLQASTRLTVQLARHGVRPVPKHVYIAPDDMHMGVDRQGCIALSHDAPEHSLRPAVSYLFRSLAAHYSQSTVGILLTGMGKDGASELKMLRDRGAITIAQSQDSCAVFGMPGEAVKLNAATYTLNPAELTQKLVELVSAL